MLSAFTPTIRPNEQVLPLQHSPCLTAALYYYILNMDVCLCVSLGLTRNATKENGHLNTL